MWRLRYKTEYSNNIHQHPVVHTELEILCTWDRDKDKHVICIFHIVKSTLKCLLFI